MPVHPILYIIYLFFKILVRAAGQVFYSKTTVINKERANFTNPCIVISNHPSTLLDPLNTAVHIRQVVFFLANASLFKHPVSNWLLKKLYCIPVERHQDTNGKPLNNKANFQKAIEHLGNGGTLYIAPEGSSWIERRLRKLKTGTARISLITESQHDWQKELTILPVGLNYSDPTKFRSELLTIIGEPVRVADFQKDWEQDETETVRKLTEHLAGRLSALIIDSRSDFEDVLLSYMEMLLKHERPLPPYETFLRTKKVQQWLRDWQAADLPGFAFFAKKTFSYFEQLKTNGLSDAGLKKNFHPASLLLLAVTFPVFLLGYLSHFLAFFSAKKISAALNADYHWIPTYKYLAGIVTVLVFQGLQIWLIAHFAGSGGAWLYVLALIPGGLFAEWWLQKWHLFSEKRRVRLFAKSNPGQMEELLKWRAGIIEQVTEAR